MNIQFQYKEFIWLLLAVPFFVLLFIVLWQWKKKVKKRMGDKNLVNALISNYSSKLFASKFIFLSFAFAFGVVAVMNPRKPGGEDNVTRKGIDVVIALDVSKSMLATDLEPSRLDRAKQLILKLMDKMPNDRIGLVVFAGKSYLQMPITVDHGAAAMYVSSASPDAVPQQGTVIADALKMSARAFNAAEHRFKSVILISDGEDHDENAIQTAKDMAAQGVLINTVGVGSPEGSTITDPATGENKKDETGAIVISKLNEETLKQVAENTNGIYVRLQGTNDAVNTLMKQLSQIEGKAFGDVSLMNYKTWYLWFAGAMLLLLLAEIFIPGRKKVVA
jgi:Ca-activated chloride channel family protein